MHTRNVARTREFSRSQLRHAHENCGTHDAISSQPTPSVAKQPVALVRKLYSRALYPCVHVEDCLGSDEAKLHQYAFHLNG